MVDSFTETDMPNGIVARLLSVAEKVFRGASWTEKKVQYGL